MDLTRKILALAVAIAAMPALAQDAATETETETESEIAELSVIEESPISSPRAKAMGGAIITSADDIDAAFVNPAGIGGLNWGKQKPPLVRKLYFPWGSAAANTNSADLYKEFKSEQGANDAAIGKAIVDANSGKRQYARTNVLLGTVFGRSMVIPFADIQVAATSRGEDTGEIDMRYRSMSGAGYGFSAQDPEGAFSLGYFGYYANRSETNGKFAYLDIINKEARTEALKDQTATYSGMGHNVGINARFAKTAKPTLGLGLTNVGDTKFEGDDGELIVEQDLAAGFSVAPTLGKSTALNFEIAADQLLRDEITFTKKYRVGLELAYGGSGSYATLALRGGFNNAGPSGGLMINVGILALEASVFSVDIGAGNEKVVEQRFMSTLMVNVAEF